MSEEYLLMLPGPTNIPERVKEAMRKPLVDHRSPHFRELYKNVVDLAQYVFQTKNDIYPLTCSGTGGVEAAIANVVSKGDKIVVPVNGLFSQRMKEKIEVHGGEVIEIPLNWRRAVTYSKIKEVVELHKGISAIAIVFNETSTGTRVRDEDMEKIGKLAKDYNAIFIVDAVSALGGDYIPVDKWNIDICITATQKCLACPPGATLVSVSEEVLKVTKNRKRGSYYLDFLTCKKFHEKHETPFTPAIPIFYALEEALKIIKEEGLEQRIRRHKICARAFYEALREMRINIFPDDGFLSNTIIVAENPNGISDSSIRHVLMTKHKIMIAGGVSKLKGKTFRIGSMGTVSKTSVLKTLKALCETLESLGYSTEYENAISKAEKILSSIAAF